MKDQIEKQKSDIKENPFFNYAFFRSPLYFINDLIFVAAYRIMDQTLNTEVFIFEVVQHTHISMEKVVKCILHSAKTLTKIPRSKYRNTPEKKKQTIEKHMLKKGFYLRFALHKLHLIVDYFYAYKTPKSTNEQRYFRFHYLATKRTL